MKTMQPVTIKLFLVNGSPMGLRIAEISNWSGKAVAGPRSELDELLQRPELMKPGVYMLSGIDAESGEPVIYIGESENVANRLKQHSKAEAKDYWNHACAFVSKDENLTKSHIRYIEDRMIKKAIHSKQVEVKNSASSGSSLPETDRADMDVFIERMIQLLPVLGIHHFSAPRAAIHKPASSDIIKPRQAESLTFSVKGITATGMRSEGGFTVFSGSGAVGSVTPSCSLTAQKNRDKLIEKGVLVRDGDYYRFTEDYEFSSPSAAGDIVAGNSTNGLTAWKNNKGKSLKELETV